MRRRLGGTVCAAATLLALAGTSGASTPALQRVTLLGDSVPDAIALDPQALAILSQGINLTLDAIPCRRVDADSCTPTGAPKPPTVVQLARSRAALGPNVVVAVGYNDKELSYGDEIEKARQALEADGVKRIWWLTLREARHPYITMNAAIFAAAVAHPEITVMDWDKYSRSHPEWFGDDGLHPTFPGARQLAQFIHDNLVKSGVALPPVSVQTTTLPPAKRGARYTAQFVLAGGLPPYSWSLTRRPPAGIRLLPNGAVTGIARAPAGTYALAVAVRDAQKVSAYATISLTINP